MTELYAADSSKLEVRKKSYKKKTQEIDWDKVIQLARHHLLQSEICLLLKLDEKRLESTVIQKAEMAENIRRGKATGVLEIAESLAEACKKGQVTAIIWWEKTRRGLAENMRLENEFESAAAAAPDRLARAIARVVDAAEKKSARLAKAD